MTAEAEHPTQTLESRRPNARTQSTKGVLQLSFRRNVVWAIAGNAVYAACQWGMLVALARLGSAESVGTFALGLALTAPIFLLTGFQLRGIQATDARAEFRFADYLTIRVFAMIVATLASVAVAFASTDTAEIRLAVAFVAIAKAFEGISDVHYGFLQSQERLDVIAHSLIARGCLSLLGLAAGMSFAGGPAGAAGGMALGWLAVLLLHDIPRARSLASKRGGSPLSARGAMLRLIRLAAPLGFVVMLVSFQTNVPRYFVEHYLGREALGIFAALASVVLAGNVFISALGQAASSRLARQIALHDMAGYRRSTSLLALLAGIFGLGGVLVAYAFGRVLLGGLFGPPYALEFRAFTWMMMAGAIGFVASILGYAMTAARQFREQVPLFIVVLGVLTVSSYLLVPNNGLVGAAWAWAIASGVQLAGAAAFVFFDWRFQR
jgi:O-antigen/teichoic acid export membrane protein